MARIVCALFHDRARASAALGALVGLGIARDRLTLVDESGVPQNTGGDRDEAAASCDLASRIARLGLPAEEQASAGVVIANGGALIAARVEEGAVDEAMAVLDTFEPVEGGGGPSGRPRETPLGGMGAAFAAGPGAGSTNTEALPGMGAMAEGTSDLGTAELRTDDLSLSDQGRSATPTAKLGVTGAATPTLGEDRPSDRGVATGDAVSAGAAAPRLGQLDASRSTARVRSYIPED
jgi:hypothetical protein